MLKGWMRLFALFAFMALILSACGGSTGSDPTSTPAGSEPKPTEPVGPEVLFTDDFSSSFSGWYTKVEELGVTDYADGEFRIYINEPSTIRWSNPDRTFGDVVIDVDARKVGGPDDNGFGVICRYLDGNNFYYFAVSSDGYYVISKYVDNEYTTLGTGQYEPSEVIKTGDGSINQIHAECVGNRLQLAVNGQVLADFRDDSLTSGDVGLFASSYDELGVDIYFDNYRVTAP